MYPICHVTTALSSILLFRWFYPDGIRCIENNIVNHAKLRVSYAEVGQAGDFLENYYSTPTYGGGFYTLTPIMYPMKGTTAYTPYYTIFDPKLKPQNTRSYEVGADVNFLDNLITFQLYILTPER